MVREKILKRSDATDETKGSDPTLLLPDFSGKVVASLKPPVANPDQLEEIPSKELTGVDEIITVLCANLCQQILKARDKSYFNLNVDGVSQGEVIVFDTHGIKDCNRPAFVVAATHDTLIFAWRGCTGNMLDFLHGTTFMVPYPPRAVGKAAWGLAV
jgi:hypothetical protein